MRQHFLSLAALVFFVVSPAVAEHRMALVIGNSNYPKAPLASPSRDVRAVSDAFRKRGFVVTEAENLGAKELRAAVETFAWTVPTRGTAIVYFSGYALPSTKPEDPVADNVLLPIDGVPTSAGTVAQSQTGVTRLLGILAKGSGSLRNIMLVDGCYAHPGQAVTSAKGLVKTGKTVDESLVVFAAATGEVVTPVADGLSSMARKLTEGLNSKRALDQVLRECGVVDFQTIAGGRELQGPASQAVSPMGELREGSNPGAEWVNDRGMIFCWCPAGRFLIGSSDTEKGHEEDEVQAEVEFSRGFWMGKFEFTRRDMQGMVGGVYLSTGDHKLHPLNKIHDVKQIDAYLSLLNQNAPEGWVYAVPTEAEWEYAAKAGAKSAFCFGEDIGQLPKFGNFADRTLRESDAFGELPKSWPGKTAGIVYFGDRQSGIFSYGHKTLSDGFATMATVGSFSPNAWGLHDMHGNVSEWTSTPYHPARALAKLDVNVGVVAKGGSWLSPAMYCRAARRVWSNVPENAVGVRFMLRRKAETPETASKTVWNVFVPKSFHSEAGLTAQIGSDGTVLVEGKPTKDCYTLTGMVPRGMVPKAVRVDALTDASLPNQGPGRGPSGAFVLSGIQLRAGGKKEGLKAMRILNSEASFQQTGMRLTDALSGNPELYRGWGNGGALGKDQWAILTVGLPMRMEDDGAIWRYPPPSDARFASEWNLEIALQHMDAATLGKFRVSLMFEEFSEGPVSKKSSTTKKR